MSSTDLKAAAERATQLVHAGRLEEALAVAESAREKRREISSAQSLVVNILLRLGRRREAVLVIRSACELAAGSGDACDGLAYFAFALGLHPEARALYRRAVAVEPGEARFWYNLASSERSLGNLNAAANACDRAIERDPGHYPAYLMRAELHIQTDERNHVEELRAMLRARAGNAQAETALGYALAKELDDLDRFDEAFHWYSAAATTRRARLEYDVAHDEFKMARIVEAFAQPPLDDATRDSGRYIFVFGLPRSGTTLVERILTGHAGVCSLGETDNFTHALLANAPQGGGDIFQRAAAADPVAVRTAFEKLVNAVTDAPAVVEKLPLNYLYVGAIARALPQAKLIWVTRSPMDSCFAMFRTLFRGAYPFTYAFEDLARYYAGYERLMKHWRKTLGDRLHEVSYEALIEDPKGTGARLANHCDLAWNPAALRVEMNTTASTTASAAQIRRPIYSTSVGGWRRYAKYLEGLRENLHAQGVQIEE
jgi:tetratricopeptide (TPR) repeat protein